MRYYLLLCLTFWSLFSFAQYNCAQIHYSTGFTGGGLYAIPSNNKLLPTIGLCAGVRAHFFHNTYKFEVVVLEGKTKDTISFNDHDTTKLLSTYSSEGFGLYYGREVFQFKRFYTDLGLGLGGTATTFKTDVGSPLFVFGIYARPTINFVYCTRFMAFEAFMKYEFKVPLESYLADLNSSFFTIGLSATLNLF